MIPIPLSLLPDDMTVQNPADADYGGEYREPFTVLHVRLDTGRALIKSDYVLSGNAKGVVYVDATNSVGYSEVEIGALLTVGGVQYSVTNVTPLRAFTGLHHYEIEVS